MPNKITNKAKQKIIGRTFNWIKDFYVDDYIQNPPLIEKLYEEKQMAIAHSIELENKVNRLTERVHELELQNQKLRLQYNEIHQRSSYAFVLSLLALIIVPIGVNIVTAQPYQWVGWLLIVVAVIIESIAFFLIHR